MNLNSAITHAISRKKRQAQDLPPSFKGSAGVIAAAIAASAATAVWVESRARRAERLRPPEGQFIDIDGVHLHYVIRGEGPPVVLLHGNNVTLDDFNASGLMDRLAQSHRVIAFDRPGFGHSSRPRDRLWTPTAQAALLHAALQKLGIAQPVVVGHSMGTMVALAMALDFPADVRSLVLISGYYYPALRVDALLAAPVALPVLGDVMRYTVTALSARLALGGTVKAMFAPNDVPQHFLTSVSREMLLRPVQLRANAEDAAFMMPEAKAQCARYAELTLPVTLVAGKNDKVVDPTAHSTRLHAQLPQSELHVLPGIGHMAHYFAQKQIMTAIDKPVFSASTNAAATADSVAQPRQEPAWQS